MLIAPWNLSFAGGDPSKVLTEPAPADSPLMVIFFGSPPNEAMFFIVH
jgi:hypothetical protein